MFLFYTFNLLTLVLSPDTCRRPKWTCEIRIAALKAEQEKSNGKCINTNPRRIICRRVRRVRVLLHIIEPKPHKAFSLIVASQYDPFSILEELSPYLGGSASIVVHSPQVQVRNDSIILIHYLQSFPTDPF